MKVAEKEKQEKKKKGKKKKSDNKRMKRHQKEHPRLYEAGAIGRKETFVALIRR